MFRRFRGVYRSDFSKSESFTLSQRESDTKTIKKGKARKR